MTRFLSEVARGETVLLTEVDTDARSARRLAELGLTPGVELTVLQASKGPLLLAVRGARVAVGQDMAAALLVSNGPGARS